MADFTGELAALGTSICFSFGSVLFTLSGRALGSAALVNRTRLVLALLFVGGLHLLTTGNLLPVEYGAAPWFWLSLSGVVGYALGDASLFQAFVMIGPRLSMLMMSLAPVLSVLLAWIFLGETLGLQDLAGISIVVAGIMWVVSERSADKEKTEEVRLNRRNYLIGLLWGLGGATGQAGGLVLSKLGLSSTIEPVADNFMRLLAGALSANMIRLIAAVVIVWLFTIISGKAKGTLSQFRAYPRALVWICIATLLGPVLGVVLNLLSLNYTTVGVAAALSSLPPIFLIPISYFAFQERVTSRAIVGTLIAIVGTVLLFL